MESRTAAGKTRQRRCAADPRHKAEPGKDLCAACAAAFSRMYPELAKTGGETQDQDKVEDMSKKAAKGKSAAVVLPEALSALEVGDLADKLYEVAAGDTQPATYGLETRDQAVDALKGMGKDYKQTLARAEHAWAERSKGAAEDPPAAGGGVKPEEEKPEEKAVAPAKKKAPAKKAGKPAPLSMPGDDEEEPAGRTEGTPASEGAVAEGEGEGEEPAPASGDPKAVIRGGGKGGAEGAVPGWRSSPARLLKAALNPLDDKWCDWDALEKAGLKGVKAARTLLKNALEHQERVEAAAKGGGKAPAAKGEVKAGAKVRVAAKHVKEYDGVLSAEDMANLTVQTVAGQFAHCLTSAKERATLPVRHLEAVPS